MDVLMRYLLSGRKKSGCAPHFGFIMMAVM
jgi:hypothetical protein